MVTVVRERTKTFDIMLAGIKNKTLKVGWFEKSKYEKGAPVAMIAAQNELGNPDKNIPARPFLRPMIIAKRTEWVKLAEKGAKAILEGKKTGYQVLELLGHQVVFDIQKAITAVVAPPLAPQTIQARLHRKADKKTLGKLDKPLIDTGILFTTLYAQIGDTE